MPQNLSTLDWKVIVFSLLGCYLLPSVLFGTLMAGISVESGPSPFQSITSVLALVTFFGPPIAGGYFTARYAANRPRLHVFVVAVLGIFLALFAIRGSALMAIGYAIGALALAALGAFLRLRVSNAA